ncbi:immunoglobulin E-set [Gaertneriomyces semiglobifer]|nr:immunoglobulin E-set [Gaertneriomyces semiglobifer]
MPPFISTLPLSPPTTPPTEPTSPKLSPTQITPYLASPWFTFPSSQQPVTFRWRHPSQVVYLTGSFDDWSCSILLPRSDECRDEFAVTLLLDRSKRWEFKFVVDGAWRCSGEWPTCVDNVGNVNNVLEVNAAQYSRRRVDFGSWSSDDERMA